MSSFSSCLTLIFFKDLETAKLELYYKPSCDGAYVYTSNENHQIEYLLTLYTGIGTLGYMNYSYGDVNGDGKNDVVIGDRKYNTDDGRASLILGSDNGYPDYGFHAEMYVDSYGASVTIGDYNGDGYGDVAIGAPCLFTDSWEGMNGEVWVYAGSRNLHDTTQSNNDEINGIDNITINAYPNPFNPDVTFSFDIKDKNLKDSKIEIYNLKGQKIEKLKIDNIHSGLNKVVWNPKNCPSGVYIGKLIVDGKPLSYKKITLIK